MDYGAEICTSQSKGVNICMSIGENIGGRLRSERIRLEMTQPQFASFAGAKKRTLIDWEQGVSSPTAVQLSALHEAGVDVVYVLTGSKTPVHRGRYSLPPLDSVRLATESVMLLDGTPLQQAQLQEVVFEQLKSADAHPPLNNDLPAYAAPLSRAERALLDHYQAADDKGKFTIESVAEMAARPKPAGG